MRGRNARVDPVTFLYTFLYLWIGMGLMFWFRSYHRPTDKPVSLAEWVLSILIWPVLVVAFPFMLYRAVREKLKDR